MRTTEVAGQASRHRGFTLIELLVVIIIVGILASLIMPTLRGAKEAAHSVVCKNSLRQRMLGVQFFVNDFGKYPFDLSEAKEHVGTETRWDFCPTVEHETRLIETCGVPFSPYGSDYLYNSAGTEHSAWFFHGPNSEGYLGLGGCQSSRLPESRVVSPAAMIAATHAVRFNMFGIRSLPLGFGGAALYGHYKLDGRPLHVGGENAVFVDGHIESKDSDRLERIGMSFKPTDADARRWNHDNQPHPETWEAN